MIILNPEIKDIIELIISYSCTMCCLNDYNLRDIGCLKCNYYGINDFECDYFLQERYSDNSNSDYIPFTELYKLFRNNGIIL